MSREFLKRFSIEIEKNKLRFSRREMRRRERARTAMSRRGMACGELLARLCFAG
jgi:hypothetical protein